MMEELNIHQINLIIKQNIFQVIPFDAAHQMEKLSPSSELLDMNHAVPEKTGGLWIFPSFFNHSCCPNVQVYIMKQYCIVRALSDIPAGAENFQSYINEMAPLNERVKALQAQEFKCGCPRCQAEELSLPEQQKIWKKFGKSVEKDVTQTSKIIEMREMYDKTNSAEKYEMARLLAEIYYRSQQYSEYVEMIKALYLDHIEKATECRSMSKRSTVEQYKPSFNFAFTFNAYFSLRQKVGENDPRTLEMLELCKIVCNWFFPVGNCFELWLARFQKLF